MGHLDNPLADKALHRYHTETMGPYWDERRKIVDDNYKDIVIPSDGFTRHVRWTKQINLYEEQEQKGLVNIRFMFNYMNTWSCLKVRDKHPDRPDPRIAVENELITAYGAKSAEQQPVKFTHDLTLLLAQKPL